MFSVTLLFKRFVFTFDIVRKIYIYIFYLALALLCVFGNLNSDQLPL